MNYFNLIVDILAVYRISLMLSGEEGPAAIFAKLRRQVPAKTNPGRGIRCFNCWSVWIAFALVLALSYLPNAWPFLYAFALSGGAMFINRISEPKTKTKTK